MPYNREQLITTLPPETRQQRCPVLLDANAVDDFIEWLRDNPDIERQFREDGMYRVGVLSEHLKQRVDWKDEKDRNREIRKFGIASQLKLLNIELKSNTVKDEAFVDEIQRAYFGNDATAHKSAELLAYGRRQSSDGRPVRIISRHNGFRSVPSIDLYVFDLEEVGIESDAMLLREIASLNLHKKVREASYDYLRNHDYPTAILHAVNELYTYIRTISGLTIDGRQLIEQVLGANKPVIQLSDLSSETKRKEQRGYAELGYGVTDALRNVLSHHLADEAFLRERFGKRHTALKFLCLLSLLFEKLEQRVAPR